MIIYLIFAILVVSYFIIDSTLYRKTSYYAVTHKGYFEMHWDKGSHGEYLLYRALKFYEKKGGRFLFNCYIPRGNGETTEIDVLMIYKSGIFVFESKNYKGWIFGNASNKTWTQTLAQGRGRRARKEHFPNPVLQNNLHIRCLKDMLGSLIPMHSVVVFSNNCKFKDVDVNAQDVCVIYRNGVRGTVKSIDRSVSVNMSDTEIKGIYEKLYPYTQVGKDVKQKHISDIQMKVSGNDGTEKESKTISKCPRCGGNLVLRETKKGNNAGSKFYGCSNYPRCRYTKPI